jgi:hypothetical protein
MQICLIDPRIWQATLDRWVVSSPDDVQRIPIAVTAFGGIFYHRKLTDTDEDVAILNPHLCSAEVLTWSLDNFFNEVLCDPEQIDDLLQTSWCGLAQKQYGQLKSNEVYEADACMWAMELLVLKCVDALQMHKRLRDAIDATAENDTVDSTPEKLETAARLTVRDALPEAWRDFFEQLSLANKPSAWRALGSKVGLRTKGRNTSSVGLYLSSHVDYRLLALAENDTYHLLFFSADPDPRYQFEPRYYTGLYSAETCEDGETLLSLNIEMRDESLGSDARDSILTVVNADGARYLLRHDSVEDIAAGIQWNSRFIDPVEVFVVINLADSLPEYSSDGIKAPLLKYLPPSVRALIPSEPLRVIVTGIDKRKKGQDRMIEVSLGTEDGLTKNMPFCSPEGAPKRLMGWVWELGDKRCKIGLSDDCDQPEIGDILVARDPAAGPL